MYAAEESGKSVANAADPVVLSEAFWLLLCFFLGSFCKPILPLGGFCALMPFYPFTILCVVTPPPAAACLEEKQHAVAPSPAAACLEEKQPVGPVVDLTTWGCSTD